MNVTVKLPCKANIFNFIELCVLMLQESWGQEFFWSATSYETRYRFFAALLYYHYFFCLLGFYFFLYRYTGTIPYGARNIPNLKVYPMSAYGYMLR